MFYCARLIKPEVGGSHSFLQCQDSEDAYATVPHSEYAFIVPNDRACCCLLGLAE